MIKWTVDDVLKAVNEALSGKTPQKGGANLWEQLKARLPGRKAPPQPTAPPTTQLRR